MRSRIEFPTSDTFNLDVIKHMVKNPEDEQFFWWKCSKTLYTLEEEKCLLESLIGLKELHLEETSVQSLALCIMGAVSLFTKTEYANVQKGLDYLQEAVVLKNSTAMTYLACMYKDGYKVSKDVSKAKALFEEAAALNNTLAKYWLGMMYWNGCKDEKKRIYVDLVKAVVIFRESLPFPASVVALTELQKTCPRHDLIQYHCTMALDPITLDQHRNLKQVGEYILEDNLIKDKYGVFVEKLFKFDQEKLIAYASTASEKVGAFLINHLAKKEIKPLTPNATFGLRRCYDYNNEYCKNRLLSLNNAYPDDTSVQYNVIMALEPLSSLKKLFNKSPNMVGQLILKDNLLPENQKYQLFAETLFESNPETLTTYALSTFNEVAQFIVRNNPKYASLSVSDLALSLRKLYATSPEEAEPQLKLLNKAYPTKVFVQYHYVMAIEPRGLNLLFDTQRNRIEEYLANDTLLTDMEKYTIFSEQLVDSKEQLKIYASFAPQKIQEIILGTMIREKFEKDTDAAFEYRFSYPLCKTELEFLQRKHPKNASIQYHCFHVLEESKPIETLYDNSPEEISQCILNDELLTISEKYQLFMTIMHASNLDKAPFSENVCHFMTLYETEDRDKFIESTKIPNNELTDNKVKFAPHLIANFTCDFQWQADKASILLSVASEDDKFKLVISKTIHDDIMRCNTLVGFANILRTEEIKKCNPSSSVNDLVDLVDQYATIFSEEEVPKVIEPEQDTVFTYTKKSNTFFTQRNANANKFATDSLPNDLKPEMEIKACSHRINNFTFEFDDGTDGLLLIIRSDSEDNGVLFVSEENKKDILECKTLSDVLKILDTEALRKNNSAVDIDPIIEVIERYAVCEGFAEAFYCFSDEEVEDRDYDSNLLI